MVTLQVKFSCFLCWKISARGVSKNMVGNCVLNLYGFLPALNFHLQCYHLRCFSFAQSESGSRVFPDLFRISLRKCLAVLGALPTSGYRLEGLHSSRSPKTGPVIIKLVGWIFKISDVNLTQGHLGQKGCRRKVSRIFRVFVPNFAPNFPRVFLRSFRASFSGRRRHLHRF